MSLTISQTVGARRSQQVLERLHTNPPNIWYDGQQIKIPPPSALSQRRPSLAALYDFQWANPQCLYRPPPLAIKSAALS